MDFFEGLLKTLSSLAVVLALVILAAAGARRWLVPTLANHGASQPLRLVHSLSLGGRRTIMVLEVGLRTLVVGATAQHLTLLTEFENHDEKIVAVPSPLPSQRPVASEEQWVPRQGRGDIKGAPSVFPLPTEGEGQGEGAIQPATLREHLTDAAGMILGRGIR
jgi:flagellar biosynthetic protein FliO